MRRYIFSGEQMDSFNKEPCPALVVGTGVAGLFFALNYPGELLIISKGSAFQSNSSLAQGGIACAIGPEDSPVLHYEDTIRAGVGLSNPESAWILVKEAPSAIKELIRLGVNFDREDGHLSLNKEGSHSARRVLHIKDRTGDELIKTLYERALGLDRIHFVENAYLVDVLSDEDGVWGAVLLTDSGPLLLETRRVILASGGYSSLFYPSTNPVGATGDGLAVALRAGATLTDLEFVQFHPTVLATEENPRFLISEAVRGEGAFLISKAGERFMPQYHPLAELAPRDVVSAAIFQEMQKEGSFCVYLDLKPIGKEKMKKRFPVILEKCLSLGIDPDKEPVPVSPAAHYTMGGIKTDTWGTTVIPGLYAVGEAACTSLHGANRLASNSLLEGLVFSRRLAYKLSLEEETRLAGEKEPANCQFRQTNFVPTLEELRKLMAEKAGIVRNREDLEAAYHQVAFWYAQMEDKPLEKVGEIQLFNALNLASLVLEACLLREESRGAHIRSDYSRRDDLNWLKHISFIRNERVIIR